MYKCHKVIYKETQNSTLSYIYKTVEMHHALCRFLKCQKSCFVLFLAKQSNKKQNVGVNR